MKLKDMSIKDVVSGRIKKIILEVTSLKFWGIVFLGYLNAHITMTDHKFDLFGMVAFLTAIGLREAADLLQQKTQNGGGESK